MKNININFQKQTIEMTKTFANSASNYGSEAYNELMNAKRDFPSYTVIIVKTASKKDSFKGLNLKYMEKYITEKSGVESEQMATFNLLCGNTEAEAIKDSIKAEMLEQQTEELEAGTYIIRWTSVLTNRFDSTAFKKEYNELYKRFTKQISSRRFSIV